MNIDATFTAVLEKLIEALRHELHQYGEMLALLDHQQESVMQRAADDVVQSVSSVNAQMAAIQSARQDRESCLSAVADVLQQPPDAGFSALAPLMPGKFRVATEALVRENNNLLVRVQQRAQTNHLLLSRSLELMQQFIHALVPSAQPTTYNVAGRLHGGETSAQTLYEAVG